MVECPKSYNQSETMPQEPMYMHRPCSRTCHNKLEGLLRALRLLREVMYGALRRVHHTERIHGQSLQIWRCEQATDGVEGIIKKGSNLVDTCVCKYNVQSTEPLPSLFKEG